MQGDVGSLTVLSCDDDDLNNYMVGCVATGLSVSDVSGVPLHSHLTIDTSDSKTVSLRNWAPTVPIFPTKSSKRGDFHWRAGAAMIMDEGGQIVTLDVDQISRPLVMRGMVADVRKPLVSGLELRNAGWYLIVDNHGSRLVQRKSCECANLLERAGVPLLPVRPREQMDSAVSPTAELEQWKWRWTLFDEQDCSSARDSSSDFGSISFLPAL